MVSTNRNSSSSSGDVDLELLEVSTTEVGLNESVLDTGTTTSVLSPSLVPDQTTEDNSYADIIFILSTLVLFLGMVALVCSFTIRQATPINSGHSTPRSLPSPSLENQCAWADRELLYLQRGPLSVD